MRTILKNLACGLVMACLWTGCTTTGDPNVDDIGFSPARAEREQLAPRRALLAQEENGTEAEVIRSRTLQRDISANESSRRPMTASIRRLRVAKAASERELASLNRRIASQQAQGRADRELIEERNRRQEEVDHLTEHLLRLLN